MKTFSALLAICEGNSPVSGKFPSQRPVTPTFDVFFDQRLNKRLSKQSIRRWFETPWRLLWRHSNAKPCCLQVYWAFGIVLTHWGRVTHTCVGKLTNIGSDNGLSPGRCQAIIWTNAGMLLIRPLGTNFSEILIEIHTFSFKKLHLKMSSGKWWPFCLGLNVLTHWGRVTHICVSTLTIIGSDNGLSPGRRQTIIWTNAGILSIGTLGTNFNEIASEIHTFSFKKMYFKISSAKWRPFCLGLNVLSPDLKAPFCFDRV